MNIFSYEKLRMLLKDLHPEIDFETETKLIENGVLDSFDMVELVSELNAEFGIKINALHLKAENFNDVDSMGRLILALQDKGAGK